MFKILFTLGWSFFLVLVNETEVDFQAPVVLENVLASEDKYILKLILRRVQTRKNQLSENKN